MSDTPNAADDSMKLLDAGWEIKLFKNGLDSYTAIATRGWKSVITDDFTPSQALYRITEKVHGRIA